MATTRITEKISTLVSSQLPEFVRSDSPTFVSFVEAYYRFLEQDQGALEIVQNARSYSDIDTTTESFVNYFLANYAQNIPLGVLTNKRLLIKRIRDLYESKGSEISFKLLFQLIYNEPVEVTHPYDYVLRPSDGRWNQRSSIRVLLTSGSIEGITDRFLTYSKNNIEYSAAILRVKSISSNLYEIFYNSRSNVPFEVGDDVVVNTSAGTIFTGTIKPTTTAYEISFGGTGFRVGEVFNLTTGGVETLVRITGVGANGSIKALKFINFGYNYSSNFTITLSNALGVASSTKYFDTSTGGFKESFTISQIHSTTNASRYFDSDYVTPFNYTGNATVTSTTTSQALSLAATTTTGGTSNPSDAILTFTIGAVARYPGEYIVTQGFLSEPDVRVQDQYLYQPFAYQVESELDISVFYDLVKKLVHPAGTNLFVNRALTSTASISANVEVVSAKNVFTQLNSVFSTLDSKIYQMQKPLANVTSISDTFISLDVYKPISDTATISESLNITLYLAAFSDSVIMGDENNLSSSFSLSDILESFSPIITHSSDDPLRYFDSNYVDPFTYTGRINTGMDALSIAIVPQPLSDSANISESLTIIRNLDPSGNLISSSTLTDTGSGIMFNYDTGTYFAEIYTGTEVLVFS